MPLFKNQTVRKKTIDRRHEVLSRAARDTTGVAAVEFAMIFPVLLVLIVGSINFGYAFYVLHSMEMVAGQAIRSATYGAMKSTEAEQFAYDQLDELRGKFEVKITENVTIKQMKISITADAKHSTLIPFPFVSAEYFKESFLVELTSPVITNYDPSA